MQRKPEHKHAREPIEERTASLYYPISCWVAAGSTDPFVSETEAEGMGMSQVLSKFYQNHQIPLALINMRRDANE